MVEQENITPICCQRLQKLQYLKTTNIIGLRAASVHTKPTFDLNKKP